MRMWPLSSDMEVIVRQKLYINILNTSKFPVVLGFQIILYTTKFFYCHWELIISIDNSLFYIELKSLVEFFEQHSITCTPLSVLNPSEYMGFPGGPSGKELTWQCRRCKRCGFNPWVGKIPWRRAWQPTPVFLPGESHGLRSLAGLEDCIFLRICPFLPGYPIYCHIFVHNGEGNGNPLQCSCLENLRNGGAWRAAIYGVAQSQTWLKWLTNSSCS